MTTTADLPGAQAQPGPADTAPPTAPSSPPAGRPFRRVVVVFNPNSSGDSPRNARTLAGQLARDAPDLPVELIETGYPGHAVALARAAATEVAGTLVVSASGDGGYHEVVNGLLQAAAAGHTDAYAAVLPSGNANDHASTVQDRPLLDAILDGGVTRLDVLALQVAGEQTRYAHSYIGLGLSPVAAVEINRHHFGAVKEVLAVMRTFWAYRPFGIVHDGRDIRVDSLVFANIDRMAKYVELSADGTPDDGRFEVVLIAHRSRPTLLLDVARALRGRLAPQSRSRPYRFTTATAMPLQLDGEVVDLPTGAEVTVSCRPGALASVR